MTGLQQQIIKTFAFFDLFDMPLSSMEVERYLYCPGVKPHRQELRSALRDLQNEQQLNFADGYWMLRGRPEEWVSKRKSARQRTVEMLFEAKPWLKRIAVFPGVEAIAVCNTLAWFNAGEDSDIDLFIITKPGHLWQTRFFLTALLTIFKKRPEPGNEYGKLCLSFFAASDHEHFSSIAFEDDIYLRYWIKSLLPVYDPQNTFDDFFKAHADFLEPIGLSNGGGSSGILLDRSRASLFDLTKPVAGILEEKTRNWQQKRFPPAIRDASKGPVPDVIINDKMLKFHTNDRRIFYRDAWKEHYAKYL